MKKVWWIEDAIVSPLGVTSQENFNNVVESKTGISQHEGLDDKPAFVARYNSGGPKAATQFELLCEVALDKLQSLVVIPKERTLFILSTTKGNIEVLEQNRSEFARLSLHETAKHLATKIGVSKHVVVSNACTSGVVAILLAKRQLEAGLYDHAVVLGADAVSKFIVSGFKSLNALSDSFCKPFDVDRTGINLGEAAATVLLTTNPEQFDQQHKIRIASGSITNDANHISGPSKTGEELSLAIHQTLSQARVSPAEIDFVSAHGTATLYNDEMEAKAFNLSGLGDTPLNSLKGNFGHTLGAAGVLESILSVQSLRQQKILPTKGFEKLGVSKPVRVITQAKALHVRNALKTSSGFGGCNAAVLFQLF